MYNGTPTRVRTECGVSTEFPCSHSGFTPGVCIEPFPVCGSARCVKRKCQERIIMGATVCRRLSDIGRDRAGVAEKCG